MTKKQPKIKAAEIVVHGVVKLVFRDGFEGVVDLRPFLDRGPMFAFLKKPSEFKRVNVEIHGHYIYWVDPEGDDIEFGASQLRRDCERQAEIHKLMAV